MLAADAFVTTAPDVVAGYPWSGAWSRDTMISFEGLFLVTGRAEEGRRLLAGYAGTVSEGMLPNTADTGRTENKGAAGVALTWMDARVDGVGVTPGAHKAVEINALWVNALATLRELYGPGP
jgi:glycogen debranching enzyme